MTDSSNKADRSREPVELPSCPPLFKTLTELIAPETISSLLHVPMKPWTMRREPMASGYSGATIERITLLDDQESAQVPTCILKHLDPSTNLLMRATRDTLCRELQFTQSPLWKQLPDSIWSPVLGCAYQNDGTGMLLMADVQPWIYPDSLCYMLPDPSLVTRILDRLAEIHAVYWNHPALTRTSWLTAPADCVLMLTPGCLSTIDSMLSLYFQEAMEMWERLWSFLDPDDSIALQHTLKHPAALLAALDHAPGTLAHGDAWLANFGEYNNRLIALDWAFVTAGPATFDSLWLANTWRTLDPGRVLSEHREALLRHGVMDVSDDATWSLLVDLGWIRAVFMGAESLVRDVLATDSTRNKAIDHLRFWCHRAATIVAQREW